MQLLEANFAQLEHINQIIHNNLEHLSWSCFDTHYLIEEHNKLLNKLYKSQSTINSKKIGTYDANNPKNSKVTTNVVDARYESFIVNITKLADNKFRYTFEIRNSLWDGGYKVTKSKNNDSDADETFNNVEVYKDNSNGNKVSFVITDDDAGSVRICFRMNMQGNGRNISVTSLIIDNPKEYTHQFDKTVCEVGYIKTEKGTGVAGVTVTITPVNSAGVELLEGIKPYSAVTDANGKFIMCYSAVDVPGDYYVMMKVQDDSGFDTTKASQIIHIKKVQRQSVTIDWGDESQYKDVWKGSIKTYEIKIGIKNEYGIHTGEEDSKLKGLTIDVAWIGLGDKRHAQTCVITKNNNNEYVIRPRCSYRQYYENESRLEVSVPLFNNYGGISSQHIVRHEWYIAENYAKILSENNNADGADWIFLKPQTYTATQTINVTREMTFAGMMGDSHPQINGNGKNVFMISNSHAETDNYMRVNILGLKIYGSQCAIHNATGCRLLVDRCFFTLNEHTAQHNRGCSIYMPVTDETQAKNNLWKCEVRNSYFHNNRGNEIQSIGTTYIHHSLFTTDSKQYLQQPEVKVVSARAGNVTYKNNKSHIRIPFRNKSDAMPSNHCYAKALAYVDKTAKFNGAGPSQLKRDNSLPLYGNPWNNEAYTYACYFYPWSVQDYIVCSPVRGKERRATGHASSAENWVYYDGYMFVRIWWGGYNTKHPWSESELTVPKNLGIYDEDKETFIEQYDPRFSGSKSLTSEV